MLTTSKMKRNIRKTKRGLALSEVEGFTLVELMVAISIFTIVMTISMGSIISVFDANRKSQSLKTVMTNLNLVVESISKEMRYGKNYHCGSLGSLTVPRNCQMGDTFISFLSSEDTQITYKLNDQTIEKEVDNGGFIAVTAPEIIIDDITFYTLGASSNDTLQPKVIIKINGHSGRNKGRSDFTIQTLVSQRVLDIDI